MIARSNFAFFTPVVAAGRGFGYNAAAMSTFRVEHPRGARRRSRRWRV
jgi:hypothetical protein